MTSAIETLCIEKNMRMTEQRRTIARMLQDIASGAHVAIIGPPGCGKSSLLKHVCAALGIRYLLFRGRVDFVAFSRLCQFTRQSA